jgi:hypothetical protein
LRFFRPEPRYRLFGDFVEDATGDLGQLGKVPAEVFCRAVGILHQVLEELHEDWRARDHLGLLLDAVRVDGAIVAGMELD